MVSASLRDIETMVKTGKFREDLYYRLCQMRINLPSLRSRKDDIPTLAKHFVKNYCHQNKFEKTIEIPPEFVGGTVLISNYDDAVAPADTTVTLQPYQSLAILV